MKRYVLSSPMFAGWVRAAIAKFGTQAELSRRLSALLKREIHAAAVNKLASGKRALAADEMLAIAQIADYPVLISLTGDTLDKSNGQRSTFNEDHLIRLFSYALQWRGLDAGAARNLAASLLEAARNHPDRTDSVLSDDQLETVARALVAALGSQRQQ
jgi:hypothetical protein